jgi:PTH1 family peptidyl-tRNA hydrolase
MKLIIGLGNPGDGYVNSRHNAGHVFVDELQKDKLPTGTIVKKTDTFMNESGVFVKKMVNKYKIEPSNLYIVHDDLDIKLGEYKIQFGKGPKGHNGILDIEDKLRTKDFWRVRIGTENRELPTGTEAMVCEKYVLQNFSDDEKMILEGTIKEACKKLETSLINTN